MLPVHGYPVNRGKQMWRTRWVSRERKNENKTDEYGTIGTVQDAATLFITWLEHEIVVEYSRNCT